MNRILRYLTSWFMAVVFVGLCILIIFGFTELGQARSHAAAAHREAVDAREQAAETEAAIVKAIDLLEEDRTDEVLALLNKLRRARGTTVITVVRPQPTKTVTRAPTCDRACKARR
jgi:hypothetical protein